MIALSSNGDKRKLSIDSIETYAYETREDLVSEKEEIKYNNITKKKQKKKKQKNIIQIGHKFLISAIKH